MAEGHRLNQHDAPAEQSGFSDEQFQTLKDMLEPIRDLAVAQLAILAVQKEASKEAAATKAAEVEPGLD